MTGPAGVAAAVLGAVSISCGAAAGATCAELEAELAALDSPRAAEAWDDVAALQEDIGRAQELAAEIAERCS